MAQNNNLLVKWFILSKNHVSLDWVHSAAGSRKLLICESHMEVGVSAKGVTEKEHMDETHYSRPSRNRRVFRLHSLQAFASEMKGRWSHRRSLSIYQRHRLSAGDMFGDSWEVLAPEGIPSLSSEWIDLSTVWTRGSAAQVRGPRLKVFCFADLWRGFVLRQDLSSNLPPLPVPSLYEHNHVQKSPPLLFTPSFFIQPSSVHHIKL